MMTDITELVCDLCDGGGSMEVPCPDDNPRAAIKCLVIHSAPCPGPDGNGHTKLWVRCDVCEGDEFAADVGDCGGWGIERNGEFGHEYYLDPAKVKAAGNVTYMGVRDHGTLKLIRFEVIGEVAT